MTAPETAPARPAPASRRPDPFIGYFVRWPSSSMIRFLAAGLPLLREPTIRLMSRPCRSIRYAVGGPKTPYALPVTSPDSSISTRAV